MMTGEQAQVTLLGITGIIAIAWVLKGITSKYITGYFKNKRKEISVKKSLSKNETEKKMYEFLESVIRETKGNTRCLHF